MKRIILVMLLLCSLEVNAVPVLSFKNKSAIRFEKNLKVGEVELVEFEKPVSLAHYGSNENSLDYIELEKLSPEANGYRKFMIKAKKAGTGELTFKSGDEIIKIIVFVEDNYSLLEDELNKLFGISGAKEEERIYVLSSNKANAGQDGTHIYLKGLVDNPKNAMLAVAFAANALGDHGVKIFSNPGGQLRMKDLGLDQDQTNTNPYKSNESSFVEYYDSANKLIDTNNLYRDLILASENEKVISYIQVKEPKRFAVQVRFLEMDSKYVDDFVSSINATVGGTDVRGSVGSTDLTIPSTSRVSNFSPGSIVDTLLGTGGARTNGISRLTDNIVSGSLVSGATKVLDNVFLNINVNDLLQEGLLRIVNEFSLITHSGEAVSLGKGTRFPIPKQNNGIGNTSITFEYIPIGFKGELKVTGLPSDLIDVQLASRLSAAESTIATAGGYPVPIFSEEYVNSGAMLADGQEVVLNTFLTETETLTKASSPLGRVIPFMGRSKRKQKTKSLLFIVISAKEIEPVSEIALNTPTPGNNFDLPHLDFHKSKNLYTDYNRKLVEKNIRDTIKINDLKPNLEEISSSDPLEMNNLEF